MRAPGTDTETRDGVEDEDGAEEGAEEGAEGTEEEREEEAEGDAMVSMYLLEI
jgi:hypothetical protein